MHTLLQMAYILNLQLCFIQWIEFGKLGGGQAILNKLSQFQGVTDEWGMGMNGDYEWGWMDKPRILFISIYPHSSPFLDISIGEDQILYIKILVTNYLVFQQTSWWDKKLYFDVLITSSSDLGGWMGINGYEWIGRGYYSSPFIGPRSRMNGRKLIPIHPHSPFIRHPLQFPRRAPGGMGRKHTQKSG